MEYIQVQEHVTLDGATMKKLSKLLPCADAVRTMTRKIAFSKFVQALGKVSPPELTCCRYTFVSLKDLQKHLSERHDSEINEFARKIEHDFYNRTSEVENTRIVDEDINPEKNSQPEMNVPQNFTCTCLQNCKVILYYHYTNLHDPAAVVSWQNVLCSKLKLHGKIRVAGEGINGTAEGCECSIHLYIQQMLQAFSAMCREDFKLSDGDGKSFHGLNITECAELCSIGIPPSVLTPENGGQHLSPEEFHAEVDGIINQSREDTILLDCRNFYESKIGYFEGALRPDLRKFSYFPAYVDKNTDVFRDKRVLMYCTGGIRCERASAYIKNAGVCKEVMQLEGGIHKYLEKYPGGHYKGKLFVFDERYSIAGESATPVSTCRYCCNPHDKYQLCTTDACRQLVLSCDDCRSTGRTACCRECQATSGSLVQHRQQCECTRQREQVPMEKISPTES